MNEIKSASKGSQPTKGGENWMCSDSKHTDENSVLKIVWRRLQMKKKDIDFSLKELINGLEKQSTRIWKCLKTIYQIT